MTVVAVAAAIACGCKSGDVQTSGVGDAGTAAEAGVEDAAHAGNGFGDPCLKNSDCAADVCLSSGRCSKACAAASDCPPGPEWVCAQDMVCACTPSGAEVCDGHDNDCDGKVDDGASCGDAKLACVAGACACRPEDACGAECFDLQTDRAHCGSCARACSLACVMGACAPVTSIATGTTHACALVADGSIRCWGGNSQGQIGDGTNAARGRPVTPALGAAAQHLFVRANHSCAVLATGDVQCWGEEASGELLAPATDTCETTPTTACLFRPTLLPLAHGTNVQSIALGANHLCMLLGDSTVTCAGDAMYGQLGDGTMQSRATLAPVPGLTNVVEIASLASTTCVRLADATVRCWGDNAGGACGDGTSGGTRATPVVVGGVSGAKQLVVGSALGCVLLGDATMRCWGSTVDGVMGPLPTRNDCTVLNPCIATSIAVPGLAGAVAIAVGRAHACARMNDGTVQCWGSNQYGQVGYSSTDTCTINGFHHPCSKTPQQVPGVTGVIGLAAGGDFTCARLAGDTVQCWGAGDVGQLGDGMMRSGAVPATVIW